MLILKGGILNPALFNEEDIKGFFSKEETTENLNENQTIPAKAEEIKIEFKPETKPTEEIEKKKFWAEHERYQTALKFRQDRLVIPKLILKFLGVFVLIFIISYTVINSPALIKKMKFFWDNDFRNKSWGTDNKPIIPAEKNESRLIIPNIKVDAPIIWNVAEDKIIAELQNGVVQYQGTALPGQLGNIFITGHSSYYLWAKGSYKDVFALLNKLSAGDKIYIQYKGATFTYIVRNQKVVEPNDLTVLAPTGENILSLMTCVPIGTSLSRLIITAEQVAN